MKIYGVYLSHYVYEVAWFKDLVKVFANENDANTYADKMNKMVKELTDYIVDAEWHCSECNGECNGSCCEICIYDPREYSEEFEITFANGDTEQISCASNTDGDPEFFVKEIELN